MSSQIQFHSAQAINDGKAPSEEDRLLFARVRRQANAARNFPENTCSSSRHLQMIAEAMVTKRGYPMLAEEPWHCAISIMATVAALYETRTELAALKASIPSSKDSAK